MKLLLSVALVLLCLIGYTQDCPPNGGQQNEDCLTKLVVDSLDKNSTLFLTITNKQSCEVTFEVGFGNQKQSVTVPAGTTVKVIIPHYLQAKVQVKPNKNCATNGGGQVGQVEMNVVPVVILPVKWIQQPRIKWLTGKKFEVSFMIAEITNVRQFNIQISNDGVTWRTITIVWPAEIEPNILYTTQITL